MEWPQFNDSNIQEYEPQNIVLNSVMQICFFANTYKFGLAL